MTMLLEQELQKLLDELEQGKPINRERVIRLIRQTLAKGEVTGELAGVKIPSLKESTPVRFKPDVWGKYGECKRCGKNDFTPGDVIVRIRGTGWWHDECYRKVNPEFYEGL